MAQLDFASQVSKGLDTASKALNVAELFGKAFAALPLALVITGGTLLAATIILAVTKPFQAGQAGQQQQVASEPIPRSLPLTPLRELEPSGTRNAVLLG